jgi:peptide/nickel transport system permease protein
MLSYVLRRMLYSIVVLFAASFLVFAFVVSTGDPIGQLRVNPDIQPQIIERIEEQKHLNDPIPVRYWYWLKDAATNEFGTTILGTRPILPDLWRVMKNTLQLVIAAQVLAIIVGVGIGLLSALRQYSLWDYTATSFSFLGLATPVFWLGLMVQVLIVQIFLATGHRIFPVANLNSVDPGEGLDFVIDRAHHLVMPVMVLMVAGTATYSRYMRASMLEVINSDYVRTARAKGLSERKVTMKHALRNALVPVVTIAALTSGDLIGGAIVTETIFALDGMGLYFVNALLSNDPYPVMAWLMITASLIIAFNLIADLLYGVLDPRVRFD